MEKSKVRIRFAPSPTGYLHVGGARTALYCYLFAKKHGGEFILRVEDTDEERSTEDSMKMQISDLAWLGLNWDEGIDASTLKDHGPYGPYRQSQRKSIYKEHADLLLKSNKAYYCFLTDEEIDAQREAAKAEGRPPQVNSPYRDMALSEAMKKIEKGESAVVRFKTPDEKRDYKLQDLVRGEVNFPSDMVGDFVLLRSSGMPVYNFCCVVDDALMKMTHVLRAEEHLSNTLRQMMLYEAFNYELPQFGHMSIILGADKQKLSKRHGATSIHDFAENGYLPEAMNNFIALLGWSHPEGKEIFSLDDGVSSFDTERLNASPAVFDEVKLKWVNATHLRALDHKDLWSRVKPFLDKAGLELPTDTHWQDKALSVFKTSMETLVDAVELFRPLSKPESNWDEAGQDVMSWESTPKVLDAWKEELKASGAEYLTEEQFGDIQNRVKDKTDVKGKHLFMPIRMAVIGKPHGAELKILVPLLKVSELLSRCP